MDKCCSKCGGKMVTGYLMAGTWLAEFTPLCDEKKLKRRHLKVLCDTCVSHPFRSALRGLGDLIG